MKVEKIRSLVNHRLFSPLCLLAALILAVAAQYGLAVDKAAILSLVLFALAAALLVLGVRRQHDLEVNLLPPQPPISKNRNSLWLVCVGLASLLAGLAFWLFTTHSPQIIPWLLHLASIVLLVVAAFLLDRIRRSGSAGQGMQVENKWTALEIGIILIIFCIAAFMRLYRFDQVPFGTWYDEADYGLNALNIINEPGYLPVYVESTQLPGHFIYLIALAFRLFGVSTLSIRSVSVFFGLATVAAAYLAGRELYNRKMGLVLAFLLAVSRWDMNWSRIGMHGVTVPFFELLTIGLLLRALRRQNFVDYTLAGLSAGLGLCFYYSFRLFPVVIGMFLLILWIKRHDLMRSSWRGLLAFCLGAIIATVPVSQLAISQPDALWARLQTTSIFTGKTAGQDLQAVLQTTGEHLLMFNFKGDGNGRHNLVGEPMLDFIGGALLVLGVGLSLWRIRQPASFLLLAWLLVMLVPGIFSLDYESPQSYRSIGSLPAAYLLVVAVIQALWQAGEQVCQSQVLRRLALSMLVLVLLMMGYLNFDTYFNRQAKSDETWFSFSTAETLIGKIMNEIGTQANYYVSVFYSNSPTIRFLAPTVTGYQSLQAHESMPLNLKVDKESVFLLDGDRQLGYQELQRDFPNATFKEWNSPGGKTALYEVVLRPEDVMAVQGITASYYPNVDWTAKPSLVRQEKTLSADWQDGSPLPMPFGVEWRGILYAPVYGNYQLMVQSPARIELNIDAVKLDLQGTGVQTVKVLLAQGTHPIVLRSPAAAGHFELRWKPPSLAESLVPAENLLLAPIQNNGLLGRYYANDNWQGTPVIARIDAWLHFYYQGLPLPRPFTVEWIGWLQTLNAGHYHFGLESIDQSSLYIDDQQVVSAVEPNQYQDGEVDLTAGLHAIRIRYSNLTGSNHVNVYWTPPDGKQEMIPQEVLFPPQGMPDLIQPVEGLENIQAPPPSNQEQTAGSVPFSAFNPAIVNKVVPVLKQIEVKTLWRTGQCGSGTGQLQFPHGIDLDQQGNLWVSDSGNKRLVEFDGSGHVLKSLNLAGQGDGRLTGPFDLIVEPDGSLLVLDTESSKPLKRFNPNGDFLSAFGSDLGVYNPRGLGIDRNGNLYLADTGMARLLRLSPAGKILQQWKIDLHGEGGHQPVSVAVAEDGSVYVVDTSGGMVWKLMIDGAQKGWAAVSPTDTVSSPRIAIGPHNAIYITDPIQRRVVVYTADGQPIGQITLEASQGDLMRVPVGIAITLDGTLLVSDQDLCQLLAFKLPDELVR